MNSMSLSHISTPVWTAAQTLWNYHRLAMKVPSHAGLLLTAGSHDLAVARYGAKLALEGQYEKIVISGGSGKVTADTFNEPESVIFSKIFIENGVPADRILVETQAANSGQNLTLTRDLLGDRAGAIMTGLLVTKPYMERRMLATAMKQWPEVSWSVTSPALELADYLATPEMAQRTIELMVGDLQRIDLYARKGFQVPQDIPQSVWSAYEMLVAAGHDAQVVAG